MKINKYINILLLLFGGSTSTECFLVYLNLVALEFGMLVFEERGKQENQQQTQPTYGVAAGIRTLATLVGGEHSDHRAIPCSPKKRPGKLTRPKRKRYTKERAEKAGKITVNGRRNLVFLLFHTFQAALSQLALRA